MNPSDHDTVEQICALLRSHEQTFARYHSEIACRSTLELAYDDFLLSQLDRGSPFLDALRRANQLFPTISLNPVPQAIRDLEDHYRFHAHMRMVHASSHENFELNEKIRSIEENIDAVLSHTLSLEYFPIPTPTESPAQLTAHASV